MCLPIPTKDFLYVTWRLHYYHKWYAFGDAHTYAQVCRFFTDDVLRTVEHVGLAQPDVVDLSSLLESRTRIQDRLRGMWEE